MKLFFYTLVAHYVADYPLQGDFLANFKGKLDYILFCHTLIWTGCVCAALDYFGAFAWWKVAFLFMGHFAIDRWKARKEDKVGALTFDLWKDQALHALQVLIVTTI